MEKRNISEMFDFFIFAPKGQPNQLFPEYPAVRETKTQAQGLGFSSALLNTRNAGREEPFPKLL